MDINNCIYSKDHHPISVGFLGIEIYRRFTVLKSSAGLLDEEIIPPDSSGIVPEKEIRPLDKGRMLRDKEIIAIS